MNKNGIRLYNVMFPVWMLVWFPSWLWLLLIPVNYLIDRLVLRWSLSGMEERGLFCRSHCWKICLAGFLADFVGSLLLFALYMLFSSSEFGRALAFNAFSDLPAFLATVFAILLSGTLIFLLDRRILTKAGLDAAAAKRAALRLAAITAPYLFLIPVGLLYR